MAMRSHRVRCLHGQLDAPTDAYLANTAHLEVRQRLLDGPALGIEDARLGHHGDDEPMGYSRDAVLLEVALEARRQ